MSLTSIIITFQPELSSVEPLLLACQSNGNSVIVVDNGSENAKELAEVCQSFERVNLIYLDANFGIAEAQNIAIKHLQIDDDELVVFFDQDSSIGHDYLNQVEETYQKLERNYGRALVLGPSFYNRVSKFEYPVIKLNKLGLRQKILPSQFAHPTEASCIISSGMTVKNDTLKQVGLMEESLFIDYVDTEWCLRARKLGYPILVDPSLVMEHEIGTNNLKLLRWRVPVHSAARRYYRIRNSFFLFNYSHVPKLTSLREIVFSIVHQVFLVIFTEEKIGHFKSLIRGVRDGLFYKRSKPRQSKTPT
ncbi:glycosyltransferase family 2 protein [Vibrio genomosp. F10 str. 9ZC157]|uniref:dTDP-rhamnosyl transferase RfbF n=1 Tax=Vibrio genomosp. F10 str. ZF-129 TaxID=1187848 RepID=A0A1E5BDB7_9VIBR|nr:glycosyltransferase family 2 protein [Vibrio genomosp. F10]OEE33138.1 dTDP-rhamnosyl transferase RfbF [Vibrio genomosp. F10 str. ZF-129]OEE95639.1 dTDP-rhamnosyl transferase RfbF [Vibrio genomosp. F10 str. 9ZC157]